MPWLPIMVMFSMLSTGLQFFAQRSAGREQQRVAEYQATLAGRQAEAMEQEAGQSRAAAQREAMEERRQGRIIRSRAAATMAGSGTTVDTDILGDIDTEAELRALTSLYRGEETARGLEYGAVLERAGAQGERHAGQVERRLADRRSIVTLAGGVGQVASLYAKYGEGQPGVADEPVVNRIWTGYR